MVFSSPGQRRFRKKCQDSFSHFFGTSRSIVFTGIRQYSFLTNVVNLNVIPAYSKVDARDDESYGDFIGDLPQC